MIPEPHVCCKCKREVVMTDCLPAIFWRCLSAEREALEKFGQEMETIVVPDIIRSVNERRAIATEARTRIL